MAIAVDVLVLMDEPAFPGCVLKCRLIGVIEGSKATRNAKCAMTGSLR